MSWPRRIKYALQFLFYLVTLLFWLGPAQVPPGTEREKIRAFTRAVEFDYIEWTADALIVKFGRAPLDEADYLDLEAQRQTVYEYLALIGSIQQTEIELSLIFSDPNIQDPESRAAPLRARLEELSLRRSELAPLAESILQHMASTVIAEMGFAIGGQLIPPLMYHSTPLPWALIVSPRDRIEQIANISLTTELTLTDHIAIEDQISETLGYSTLVVPVGGVGTYPTMVQQTTNLNWLATVIAHEWLHNYLTLRPLGIRYDASPELRTINETTASIAGDEIGVAIIAAYFPELVPPPPPPPPPSQNAPSTPPPPPAFDFRAEMFETRTRVDDLLAEGKIEEAEAYMEARRQVLWENGYRLRKLNQAYFAFHGAYADQPVGSAGEDPVGAAVRALRQHSGSLLAFIESISQVTSYDQLLSLLP
jgi:hypothetical protein